MNDFRGGRLLCPVLGDRPRPFCDDDGRRAGRPLAGPPAGNTPHPSLWACWRVRTRRGRRLSTDRTFLTTGYKTTHGNRQTQRRNPQDQKHSRAARFRAAGSELVRHEAQREPMSRPAARLPTPAKSTQLREALDRDMDASLSLAAGALPASAIAAIRWVLLAFPPSSVLRSPRLPLPAVPPGIQGTFKFPPPHRRRQHRAPGAGGHLRSAPDTPPHVQLRLRRHDSTLFTWIVDGPAHRRRFLLSRGDPGQARRRQNSPSGPTSDGELRDVHRRTAGTPYVPIFAASSCSSCSRTGAACCHSSAASISCARRRVT